MQPARGAYTLRTYFFRSFAGDTGDSSKSALVSLVVEMPKFCHQSQGLGVVTGGDRW
jgi:hypothetical protein